MLEWKASRHRRPCRFAVVQRGIVIRRCRKAGITPGCELQGTGPCESVVAGRRMFSFGSMLNGDGENACMWVTTSEAKTQSRRINLPSDNSNSSGHADGIHPPVRPMAAHQLGKIMYHWGFGATDGGMNG